MYVLKKKRKSNSLLSVILRRWKDLLTSFSETEKVPYILGGLDVFDKV